jgi:transposase
MIQERARELNRIQKMLEGANIKLGSVVSSIDGISATAMIDRIIAGETDAKALALLAQGALRKKIDKLELSLDGLIGEHLRMILQAMRSHVNTLEELIAKLDTEIERRLQPHHELVEALDTIPGVGTRSAQIILAEIGTDMSVFPTAHHLASWAGLCPGNYMSAGKQKSSRTRKCNKSLKTALAQCAKTNSRSKKGNYLSAQYRRLAARRGANRATIAVAHSILIIAYHIIKDGTEYRDLGSNYFDERKETQVINRSVKRLEALGYDVTVREKSELPSA